MVFEMFMQWELKGEKLLAYSHPPIILNLYYGIFSPYLVAYLRAMDLQRP